MSTSKGPSAPVTTDGVLAALPHDLLATVAREHMLWGHLIDRALMPELIIAVDITAMEAVAIDEWMGASPNYTARMRTLMGVTGDSVADIMKVLQLDVGFVHEYMAVGYRVIDHDHGEFWLDHCGALVDAEPMGDRQVISMCHHIEDPTFDATAVATNPRVRIRPVHRPPRSPAGRTPVCHWTVVIDPGNEPLGFPAITDRVGALALANVTVPSIESVGAGDPPGAIADYRGTFEPDFRLDRLSSGALRVVLREFALQCHLIAAAGAMAIADRHGEAIARSISAAQAVGVSWVGAQRLARVLGAGAGAEDLATIMAVHPLWPTSVAASASIVDQGRALTLAIEAPDGVLDPDAPGWLGLLASGDLGAVEAVAAALGHRPTAAVIEQTPTSMVIDIGLPTGGPAPAVPRVVDLLHFSSAADWQFSSR